jgi:hypothetical protein
MHDPDGHPVCTWCIQPLDKEGSVKVKRRGKYHVKCYDAHMRPWGGEVEW